MPSKRISFSDFNRRLILSGGREQTGPGALRRASGVAPEGTTSVMSRWGSQSLYAIDAIQCYYWNSHRYQYDGAILYKDGVSVKTGFDGTRLTFVSMPPQEGLQDYLFILGGGLTPFKIAPDGSFSNWGIVAPNNVTTANNIVWDQIVIDSFVGSVGNWTPNGNCFIANEGTEFITGTGSLKVNPSGTPWHIVNNGVATLNLGSYSNGHISLDTDVIQIWVLYAPPTNQSITAAYFLQFDFDVTGGAHPFTNDYYTISAAMIPSGSTNPRTLRHPTNISFTVQYGQWQQLTIPKSEFRRIGTALQKDWSNVQGVRISGNNILNPGVLYLDNLTLSGGAALGAGPAVGQNGSEYDYQVTYLNLTTGSESNPNKDPIKIFGVADNAVSLTNIPVSSDTQVGARRIYRSSALNDQPGGAALFYLDTIYDNTTTIYTDLTSDISVPEATTPWQKSVAVPPNTAAPFYVDGGNGYYFKLTTNGTTAATAPNWVVPTTTWSAVSIFLLNETTSERKAAGQFWQVTTAGTSATVEPNWAGSTGVGATINDGTVVWTNIGTRTTADNTAIWTYQGINSTKVLSNQQVLLDNAPPQTSYGDAAGPFEGSMLWTRDSAQGQGGYIYMSPPGRPESVSEAFLVSGTNDPMQKVVIWDSRVWALSTARAFKSSGSFPGVGFQTIDEALGTSVPYTVCPVQFIGIAYWAPDGIRVVNWAGSRLIGFQQLAPIFRGQGEENITSPWSGVSGPIWAALLRNEIVFSDSTALTLGITYDGNPEGGVAWRQPGQILTAAYYEHQTGEVQAAWDGHVYLFEHPGSLTDG